MAHAYTPGLKVAENQLIIKSRILPIKGEVVVKKGDIVKADDIVAETYLPGNVFPMNFSHILNVSPDEVMGAMLKKEGDEVKRNELIAETKGFFGFFKSKAHSKIDGKIESISSITGQVILRSPPTPVQVKAYIDGVITEVFPHEGVKIQTHAALIQGIFGIGGETNGDIVFACNSPDEPLDHTKIKSEHRGKIVVGGSIVTADALRKAVSLGVKGIISGGIDDQDLRSFIKADIGVAITGAEKLGISVIITEGFSSIEMSSRTYNLLKKNEGKFACINGATQIRAGVLRPEIIIPVGDMYQEEFKIRNISTNGITVGSSVRIIREPYFGKIGIVTKLPSELVRLESSSMARVCKVEIDHNEVVIPRANIEIIES
ncbi:MAG: hypothetical protein ABIE74_08380 [Pseudomonadota bacterium]